MAAALAGIPVGFAGNACLDLGHRFDDEFRLAMKSAKITELPLYPEQRLCQRPPPDRYYASTASLRAIGCFDTGVPCKSSPPSSLTCNVRCSPCSAFPGRLTCRPCRRNYDYNARTMRGKEVLGLECTRNTFPYHFARVTS